VHQGEKFCLQYDANSYLYISKAMDLFDLSDASRGQPAIERITCPVLVIGASSDLLFPVWQQRELAAALRKHGATVTYVEIDAPFGHDTFLIDRERVGGAVRAHLEDPD
jgi:homoserine O-acetyltransferase